jgi:hypothetical protein
MKEHSNESSAGALLLALSYEVVKCGLRHQKMLKIVHSIRKVLDHVFLVL